MIGLGTNSEQAFYTNMLVIENVRSRSLIFTFSLEISSIVGKVSHGANFRGWVCYLENKNSESCTSCGLNAEVQKLKPLQFFFSVFCLFSVSVANCYTLSSKINKN